MSNLSDTALRIAAKGKPVFPVCWTDSVGQCIPNGPACKHPGKVPLVSWKPYQDHLPTEEQITTWWTKWQGANIGMTTGHLSGWIVIDSDSAVATKRFEDSYPEARDTLQAQTGRDGARHFYFVDEEGIRNDAGKLLGEGIDIRGEGGYVVFPPSVHANGKSYQWLNRNKPIKLPDKLREILINRSKNGEQTNGGAYRERFNTAEALNGVPEGQRDETIFKLACKLRNADVPKGMAEALWDSALYSEGRTGKVPARSFPKLLRAKQAECHSDSPNALRFVECSLGPRNDRGPFQDAQWLPRSLPLR